MSEVRPIMTQEQVEKADEISKTFNTLAILKIQAANRGDRNKYNLICKQQGQVAAQAMQFAQEVEDGSL